MKPFESNQIKLYDFWELSRLKVFLSIYNSKLKTSILTTMVAIGDVKQTGSRVGKSKSKQFTLIVASMGLLALLFVARSSHSKAENGVDAHAKTNGSFRSSISPGSDKRITSNAEYEEMNALDNTNSASDTQEGEGERRIRQISLLGERNSGTRWTYSYVIYFFVWFLWLLNWMFDAVKGRSSLLVFSLLDQRHLSECFNHSIPVSSVI